MVENLHKTLHGHRTATEHCLGAVSLANPLHIIYMLEVEEQEGKIKRLWNELPKIKITEKVLSED